MDTIYCRLKQLQQQNFYLSMSHHASYLFSLWWLVLFCLPFCFTSLWILFVLRLKRNFSPDISMFLMLLYSANILSDEYFVLQKPILCHLTNKVCFQFIFFVFVFFSSFKWKLFIFPFAKVPIFSQNLRSIQTSDSVITLISSFHGHFLLLVEITGQHCRQFTLFSILN